MTPERLMRLYLNECRLHVSVIADVSQCRNTPPMRLTDDQIQAIGQSARQIGGEQSRVRVFGSRLDDSARDEVIAQLAYIREWGGQFVRSLPGLTLH